MILTEANALAVITAIICLLGGILLSVIIWYVKKLISNLDHLDKTVTTNNIYQKQHFDMIKELKADGKDYNDRLIILEHKNGKV